VNQVIQRQIKLLEVVHHLTYVPKKIKYSIFCWQPVGISLKKKKTSLQNWLCWLEPMQIKKNQQTHSYCALVYLTKFKHEDWIGDWGNKCVFNVYLTHISYLIYYHINFNTYCIQMLHVCLIYLFLLVCYGDCKLQ